MIRKFGMMLFVLASCSLLTLGCQEQTDKVVKNDPVLRIVVFDLLVLPEQRFQIKGEL